MSEPAEVDGLIRRIAESLGLPPEILRDHGMMRDEADRQREALLAWVDEKGQQIAEEMTEQMPEGYRVEWERIEAAASRSRLRSGFVVVP